MPSRDSWITGCPAFAGHDAENVVRLPSGARLELLLHFALDLAGAPGELVLLRLDQEGVEAAAAVDGLERIGRDAQLHRAAERVRHHGDVDQVGEEAPLGLDVRVADLVPDLRAFAGQFATPRHG